MKGRVFVPEGTVGQVIQQQQQLAVAMAGLIDKAKEVVADKIAKMEKPTADLSDVDIKNVSRSAINLKSDVLIHNPYDHDLPILEVTYRLRCGDR